jgi:conjugative transposon TraN protein
MKTVTSTIFCVLQMMLTSPLFAQTSWEVQVKSLKPTPVLVSFNKTTSMTFPQPVKSVDIGSAELHAHIPKDAENTLFLRTDKEPMRETSLTVITQDGFVFPFVVNSSGNADVFNYEVKIDSNPGIKTAVSPRRFYAASIAKKHFRNIKGLKSNREGIKLRLTALFVDRDVMYLQLEANNSSYVDFEIGLVRFFSKDINTAVRTASQEVDFKPLDEFRSSERISKGKTTTTVVALPKFTLPNRKFFAVEFREKNGARTAYLKVHRKLLFHAGPLPDKIREL